MAQTSRHNSSKRRIRKLKRFRGRKHRVEPAAKANEQQPTKKMARAVARKRFSLGEWLFRLILYPIILIGFVVLLGYSAIQAYVEPEDLIQLLTDQVAQQTGGRLEIDGLEFNILTGVELQGVRFYPPLAEDTNLVDPETLFSAQSVVLKYSLPRVLLAKIHVNAVQLREPEVRLIQRDGKFNFEGILAYRESLPQPAKEEQEEEAAASGEINTELIVLPIELLAQNIGIRDLRFSMRQEVANEIKSLIATSGLNVDLGVEWFGADSHLWASVDSGLKQPFVLEMLKQPESGLGLEQLIRLQTFFKTKADITDLQSTELDFVVSELSVQTREFALQDIGTFVDLDFKMSSDLKSFDIESMVFGLDDILNFQAVGSINLPRTPTGPVATDIKSSLRVALDKIKPYSSVFLKPHTLTGNIEMTRLDVSGPIDPKQFEGDPLKAVLPFVTVEILLEKISASYPEIAAAISDVDGLLKLAVGPDAASGGSFAAADIAVSVPTISIGASKVTGGVAAGIGGLSLRTKSRLQLANLSTPLTRLNLDVAQVRVKQPDSPELALPFYIDASVDGSLMDKEFNSALDTELGDLLNASVSLDCSNGCRKVRHASEVRVAELARVHEVAAPFAAVAGMEQYFPISASGAIDTQLQARGDLLHEPGSPDFGLHSIDKSFNVRGQFDVADVNVVLPVFAAELSGFELRGFANGDFLRQRFNLSTGFSKLKALPPGLKEPVNVERMRVEAKASNKLAQDFDLANPLPSTDSTVDLRVELGRASVAGILPDPIRDLGVGLRANQAGVSQLSLDELTLSAPQYGIDLLLTAKTKVDKAFMPESLAANINLAIDHNGQEKLPMGLETSGAALIAFGVESKDMRSADLTGNLGFNEFSIRVPQGELGAYILEVENLEGKLPVAQKLNIENFLALAQQQELDDKTSTSDQQDQTQKLEVVDSDRQVKQALDKFLEKKERRAETTSSVASAVDYNTLRSFYPERFPISVERIAVANLELNRFELDVELRQNQFSINQFFVNFLGGRMQGSTQVNFDSGFLTSKKAVKAFADGRGGQIAKSVLSQIKTSVHLTRLNTTKLIEQTPHLKDKASNWADPYLDASVYLDFDAVSNDIQGGIEITSIGKEQLKMILYYVDPYEKNPTINDIRTALALGDVKLVSIPIKNGEVGLDVDIRVLHAPLPTPKLSRFPISKILDSYEADAGSAPSPPKGDKA